MDLTGVIVAVLAALAAFVTGWMSRPKTTAEAGKLAAETSDIVTQRLYKEINRLYDEITKLQGRFDSFETDSLTKVTLLTTLLEKATSEIEGLRPQLTDATSEVTRLREIMSTAAAQLDASKPAEAEATLKKIDEV